MNLSFDGSDEKDCQKGQCREGQKECKDGQCIAENLWCDGPKGEWK